MHTDLPRQLEVLSELFDAQIRRLEDGTLEVIDGPHVSRISPDARLTQRTIDRDDEPDPRQGRPPPRSPRP
jgi:hypothetical protein